VNVVGSRYVEKRNYLSPYSHERMVQAREARAEPLSEFEPDTGCVKALRQELPRFIPFLQKCGLDFHGRILEIGAGVGWLSAELSKLPRVVEVFATDFSTKVLREHAPRVFNLLNAHAAKIIRTPGDFHKLDFPSDYFDFVVSSAALQHATNPVQVLREVKRVLKSGGRFVAIREPVWPLVRLKSRGKKVSIGPGGLDLRHRTLSHYQEFFRQAGLPLEVRRVNLAQGFRYYFGQMVNGLTHARYAFIGLKKTASAPAWQAAGLASTRSSIARVSSRKFTK
jgi:SAM-dependent methyltransferase